MQTMNQTFLDTFSRCDERQWNGGLYEVEFCFNLRSDDSSLRDIEKYLDECYGEKSQRDPKIYSLGPLSGTSVIKLKYDAKHHEEGREITSFLLRSWFKARKLMLDATDVNVASLQRLPKPVRQIEGQVQAPNIGGS